MSDWTAVRKKPAVVMAKRMEEAFEVNTLEGVMRGRAGDVLIEGVMGEHYPCAWDIFVKSYEVPARWEEEK